MRNTFIYLAVFLPFFGAAQTTISLKSAIDTTLRNSFDIQIAGNNLEISKINNTLGVAGALPTISATVSDNQSIVNINQKYSTGNETNKSSTDKNVINSGISAGIVLFNGFKITATKERLSRLQQLSQLQLNNQIQNTIAMVSAKYYDVVRQQEYLKIIQNSLDVSHKKLEIITERKNVGMANDADFLQAQIDVNAAQQTLRSQQMVVEQTKTDLLQLMSQKQFYPFTTTDSMVIDHSIQLSTVTNFLNKNPQYLSSEQQILINEQVVKEVSALRYPSLRFNTGYNFSRTKNSAGLYLFDQNYGPTAGLSLQIPIYNGNAYKVQKETALLNVDNAKLQQESLLNTLTSGAVKTFQTYSSTLQQLEYQQNSVELSGKLIKVILQRFQVNQATILEVKAAQASYENTGYQLVNLSFAAKIAEIELKRLMYQLGN